ncbi:MAG TPA: aldehyde dehydrogenase family protein [Chryseosolibacter sp.]|nr:aldehyde dehydrogenase family protein [Chryseosolibacter sp.]
MSTIEITTREVLRATFRGHQLAVRKLREEPVSARITRLNSLRTWIKNHRNAIHQAMHNDFQKNPVEVDAIEIYHVLNEIREAIANLDRWTAKKKIDAPLTMIGTRSHIQYEPKGVSLIISPWNYPFSLAVGPLVSALAAGNSVVIKPSEMTPHVSALIRRMVEEIFQPGIVSVFEGDAAISSELLRLPFDHIFFTGSPSVGKIVMKAAADNLASVTLELGGKSPTIVSASASLEDASERIAVAKFVNNGQTCIAPDYVLVHESVAGKFLDLLAGKVKKRFAVNGNFQESPSYCRIVNGKHFQRLNNLLQDALTRGAKIELGGNVDERSRFFPPMILSHVPSDSAVMQEEIFGPILPVVTYATLEEAINLINARPKPLALYLFTRLSQEKRQVLQAISAGGVCINDSAIHFLHHKLPFGGTGNSGIGKSHGHYGFLAFSNEKPVLQQRRGFTSVKLLYPPYTAFTKRIMDWFLKLY